MFDKQKFFDTGVLGIRRQGQRAVSEGSCVYRSPSGLKCFVGHNIPDSAYTPNMENSIPCWDGSYGVDDSSHRIAVAAGAESKHDALFMRVCQSAHDGAVNMDDFVRKARSVAARYNLNTDCITQPL
jgi:hypothetical protein